MGVTASEEIIRFADSDALIRAFGLGSDAFFPRAKRLACRRASLRLTSVADISCQ